MDSRTSAALDLAVSTSFPQLILHPPIHRPSTLQLLLLPLAALSNHLWLCPTKNSRPRIQYHTNSSASLRLFKDFKTPWQQASWRSPSWRMRIINWKHSWWKSRNIYRTQMQIASKRKAESKFSSKFSKRIMLDWRRNSKRHPNTAGWIFSRIQHACWRKMMIWRNVWRNKAMISKKDLPRKKRDAGSY